MSNTADVLYETETEYSSPALVFTHLLGFVLLIYSVFCVVYVLFFCLRSVFCSHSYLCVLITPSVFSNSYFKTNVQTGWFGVRIMCRREVTCLPAGCCFSDLALYKSNLAC